MLEICLVNLGLNASHALSGKGKITFEIKNKVLDDIFCSVSEFNISAGNYVDIAVRDNGVGMSKEIIDKILNHSLQPNKREKEQGLVYQLFIISLLNIKVQYLFTLS